MSQAPNRLYELDILRFLAAFGVMIFHYTFRGFAADGITTLPYMEAAPITKYGALSVNLFFMISGFVILMTASNNSVRKFVISRVVRLYPAFWFCCTLTFIAMLIFNQPRYHITIKEYLLNMTMLSGLLKDVPYVDGVYWTLLVEIKFYALIFILLLFKQIKHVKKYLGLWFILTMILSVKHIPVLPTIFIPDYSVFFIAGALFYLVYSEGLCWYKVSMLIASFILIMFKCIDITTYMIGHYHTDFSYFTCVLIFCVFFIIFFLIALKKTASLSSPQWVMWGALTYPLYLIHQNIGFMIFNHFYPAVNRHIVMAGTILGMLVCVYLIQRFVEKPLAKWMKKGMDAAMCKPPSG